MSAALKPDTGEPSDMVSAQLAYEDAQPKPKPVRNPQARHRRAAVSVSAKAYDGIMAELREAKAEIARLREDLLWARNRAEGFDEAKAEIARLRTPECKKRCADAIYAARKLGDPNAMGLVEIVLNAALKPDTGGGT